MSVNLGKRQKMLLSFVIPKQITEFTTKKKHNNELQKYISVIWYLHRMHLKVTTKINFFLNIVFEDILYF